MFKDSIYILKNRSTQRWSTNKLSKGSGDIKNREHSSEKNNASEQMESVYKYVTVNKAVKETTREFKAKREE